MAETTQKPLKEKPREEKIFDSLCAQGYTVIWLCAIGKMSDAPSWVEVRPEHVKYVLDLHPTRESFRGAAEGFVLAMYPKENKNPRVCNLRGSTRIAMKYLEQILYGPEEKTSKEAPPVPTHLP